MTRRRVRRLYREATRAYEEGIRRGLASRKKYDRNWLGMGAVAPTDIAEAAGHDDGAEWEIGKSMYSVELPLEVWALVLAEEMRPRG